MAKKPAMVVPDSLLNKRVEIKAPESAAEEKPSMSEAELIDLRTINVFTLRVNDDFRNDLNAIKGDLAAFRFTAVECVRHIALHTVLTPVDQRFAMATAVYKESEGLKKSSTTFGFNKFTKLKLEECLAELTTYSKQKVNMNLKFDVTGLLTQAVYNFAMLSRDDKVKAIKEVKAQYADMLHYLTPAQAEAAKQLL
jgi:hypothetical protein